MQILVFPLFGILEWNLVEFESLLLSQTDDYNGMYRLVHCRMLTVQSKFDSTGSILFENA